LAEYAGTYVSQQIGLEGKPEELGLDVTADDGELVATVSGQALFRFAFYRKDYVLALNPDGTPTHVRANFVRGDDGQVEWLRYGGRLFRRRSAIKKQLRRTKLRHPATVW
jgi:hypothetical protein